MSTFGIRFLLCNLWISFIIAALAAIKHLFRKHLSAQTQYTLWFPVLGLLIVPFLPTPVFHFPNIISTLLEHPTLREANMNPAAMDSSLQLANDFAVSVSSRMPVFLNTFILIVWIAGTLVMTIFFLHSYLKLHQLKQSALPVENRSVQELFTNCSKELNIRRKLPLYSTFYLNSPALIGIFKPGIYLPLSLISDFKPAELRYIFLHELQHYRHKDTFINAFANFVGIIYWFNPFIWYVRKELQTEREIACDYSVLEILDECEHNAYGYSLINYAEKLSFPPFPFATGIGGNKNQLKRRIKNISNFQPTTFRQKTGNILLYFLISCLLIGNAPALSIFASGSDIYHFNTNNISITAIDLSTTFGTLNGSFVLYDAANDCYSIYNEELAKTRISPNSTYKIYDALLALEQGIISPDASTLQWDGTAYPFDEWESNQDLTSAMQNSVNWYFQTLDAQAGFSNIHSFLREIEYGNETTSPDIELYWADSSLKISPIEQVELLQKLYRNDFSFKTQNIEAVKQALHLTSSTSGEFYGKTGTGRVDNQDINGWFVGFIETSDNVYYFATNIQGDSNVTGSKASEITLDILSELNIWTENSN